jgi:hypothetical protein
MYAQPALGTGITMPKINIDLSTIGVPDSFDLQDIFNPTSWTPTPFVQPTFPGTLPNSGVGEGPLNTAKAAAGVSPYIIGGIAAVAWLLTRKKR